MICRICNLFIYSHLFIIFLLTCIFAAPGTLATMMAAMIRVEPALVVALAPHGEHAVVARFLSADQGLVAAYVQGGRGRKLRPVLQIGNRVALDLVTKSAGQLAFATVHPLGTNMAMMHGPAALALVDYLASLSATCLNEGEAQPRLFPLFDALFGAAAAGAARAHLRSKEHLLGLLRARVLDKAAYVRQRTLRTWAALVDARCVPLSWWNAVLRAADAALAPLGAASAELDREAGLFRLIETAPGVTVDEVKAKTAAKILVDRPVTAMRL